MKTSVVTWRKNLPLSHTLSLFLSFLLHCFVAYRCSQLIWFGPPKPLTLPDWSLFDEGDKDAFPLERMFIVPAPPSSQSLRWDFASLSCLITLIILFSFYLFTYLIFFFLKSCIEKVAISKFTEKKQNMGDMLKSILL